MQLNFDEFWSGIGQVIVGILAGLLAFASSKVKKLLTERRSKCPFRLVNASMSIKDLLTEIRVLFDADRVKLFQVHNGDYFVNGSSSQKITLTHFVVRTGVGSPYGIETTHQNIPISYVVGCIDQCLKNPVYFSQVGDMADDMYFKALIRHNGSETALFSGVFDRHKGLLGIVVVTWLERLNLDEDKQKILKSFAARISDELMFKN